METKRSQQVCVCVEEQRKQFLLTFVLDPLIGQNTAVFDR